MMLLLSKLLLIQVRWASRDRNSKRKGILLADFSLGLKILARRRLMSSREQILISKYLNKM